MARKLTEEERQEIEAMRAQLTEALPPAQRGIASGIASALVRTPADTITEDDLGRIMGKYDEADASVAQTVKDQLLDAVDGEEGRYVLRPLELTDAPDGTLEEQDGEGNQAPEGQAPEEAQQPDDAGQGAPDGEPSVNVGQADGASPEVTEADEAPQVEAGSDQAEDLPTDARPTDEGGQEQPEEPQEATGQQDLQIEGSEPAIEAPAPKAKRTRRGARRTHKTAASIKAQVAEDVQSAAQRDKQPEAKDKERGGKQDKPKQGKEAKTKDAPAATKEGPADKDKGDKGHRKEQAPSRDLKKVPYVRRGGETEAEVRQKILELDQRFWVNGWLLSHPAAYTLYERELVAINDALSDGMLPGDITRRQLAYQMGGDEKFFEYGSDGFRLLRAMGMEDVIRHRPMPKPDLVYYAPRRRKHMRVLVTENLDPYLDVHDLMYEEGRTSILGQRIHAVVLGGGTPILEKNRLALLLDTLGADTITVLYWGDIDRAGLEIMVKLKDVLGDGYKFRAFTPAYQLMVDKAQQRFPDPADNESTGQVNIEPMDASLLVKGLTEEAAAYAKAVIDDCGLIPQEILTRRDL